MTEIKHNPFAFSVIFILLTLFVAGCVSGNNKREPILPASYGRQTVVTASFQLYTEQKITAPGQGLVFYIEGDGKAWVTRNQLSTDPTPVTMLVRNLAYRDTRPNIIYLARPCQYVGTFEALCAGKESGTYWSEKRFAPEVISSMNEAINQVKNQTGSNNIILVGYSGGGAIAALLAAQRNDVVRLVTIAGNLDTEMHSKIHGVSPLTGSLNPRDFASKITVPQLHFIGGKDENIPAEISRSFIAALPKNTPVKMITIPEAAHNDGWENLDLNQSAYQ